MYFPYLRGRQNELLALLEINRDFYRQQKLIPIIEPVSTGRDNMNRIERVITEGIQFILILNPQVGQLINSEIVSTRFIPIIERPESNAIIGIMLTPDTSIDYLNEVFNQYAHLPKALIHTSNFFQYRELQELCDKDGKVLYHVFNEDNTSPAYRQAYLGNNKVIVRDGFTKYSSNGAYPVREAFCRNAYLFRSQGYCGCGDYLIVGDSYSEEGGGPSTVAIHLTTEADQEIIINHFLSDSREGRANVAAKYIEALTHLISFVNNNGLSGSTSGILEFEESFRESHFPGLGPIKKMSIKHHLEFLSLVCHR